MRRACCIFTILLFLCSCSRVEISGSIDAGPDIFPDYKEVTVPENISPLNFSYLGEEKAVLLVGDEQIRARKGLFKIRPSVWKSLMTKDSTEMTVAVCRDGKWMSLRPFRIFISHDKIDPYIAYRLIPPGYQGWKTMGIFQRNLESYEQKAIVRNSQTGENCVNCHSFANRDPSNMVFHSRATFGGTMLFSDGILEKLDTKTDSTISALVYPYWHPTGKFIAFSVNNTKQVFLSNDPNRVEVFDAASDVVVYDVKNHCVTASPLTKSPARFETFPTFSPDGRWLYFCSASAVKNLPERYKNVRYGLYRVAFDADSRSFGDSLELVYDAPADSMSVSFPRISPDGNFMAVTLHGYGNFSIWHKDADIRLLDLRSGRMLDEAGMNSKDVESYHSWSGNSRWLIFSSRRMDGLYTRPYITHIDADGHASKPFLLPQKDPMKYYGSLMFSYNIPEFISGKIKASRHSIVSCMRKEKGKEIEYFDSH
jgi:hypothetical protein